MNKRDRRALLVLIWRMRAITADPDEAEDMFRELDEGEEETYGEAEVEVEVQGVVTDYADYLSEYGEASPLPGEDRLGLLEKVIARFMERGEWNGLESTAREAAERMEDDRQRDSERGE